MYKIFLCLRYLRTRYIVLASIISVMLGVATMIVVNSVMSGFANEMQTRIHGILGDVMVTSTSADGFYDPEGQMQKIRDTLGDDVIGMTPICTTVGVLTYKTRVLDADGYEREAQLTEQVCIVGIDEESKNSVGDFGKFLQHPENRKQLSFALREAGYDTFENQKMMQSRGLLSRFFSGGTSKKPLHEREEMKKAGWKHRLEYYGDPKDGVEIITNQELHVESKNAANESLPTMKKEGEEEEVSLTMMDPNQMIAPQSDHPMDNPPETPILHPAEVSDNSEMAGSNPEKDPMDLAKQANSGKDGVSRNSPFDVHPVRDDSAAHEIEAPVLGVSNAESRPAEEGQEFNLNESLEAMKKNFDPEAENAEGNFSENVLGQEIAEGSEESKNSIAETEGMFSGNSIEDPFNPFGDPVGHEFDPEKETHPGIIIGIGMAMFRNSEGKDRFYLLPGRDVMLTFPDCNIRPQGVSGHFTCVDLYESKMSEYDSQFVFVSMKEIQKLRGMPNKANQIQIQLREGVDLDAACEKLQKVFDPQLFICKTWRDDKMPLLQAVDMEIAILNVLLFMIIAVSGFGILAIFYMVVTEKTRDIGILKALGASSWGIMSIFLMYGLALGIVGAGLGLLMGLIFVLNINEIADFLSWVLGHEVFSPDIYYFYQIPYDISLATVGGIVGGALIIAVLASVFPAWHASRLQPVESLRYE